MISKTISIYIEMNILNYQEIYRINRISNNFDIVTITNKTSKKRIIFFNNSFNNIYQKIIKIHKKKGVENKKYRLQS